MIRESDGMGSGGIQTRPAQAEDIPALGEIVVQSWRHTFEGVLPTKFLNSMSVDHQQRRHVRLFPAEESSYHVAFTSEGKVVGFASGGPSRQPIYAAENELYAIYLMPDFLHQGIGRRLFGKVTADLAASGREGLVVMALSLNPNRTFYSRLGGVEVDAPSIQLGDDPFPQTAFVWPEMPTIATSEHP